jgi:hypothetical protein
LKRVSSGIEVVFAANFLLQFTNLGGEELNRDSALRANHVVMIAAIELVFVARNTVVKSDLTSQSTFGQQLERAINSCETDLGIFFPGETEKFVGGEMVARLKERAENRVALIGMFQPNALQMFIENLLRLTHSFACRRRVIINAALQHDEN